MQLLLLVLLLLLPQALLYCRNYWQRPCHCYCRTSFLHRYKHTCKANTAKCCANEPCTSMHAACRQAYMHVNHRARARAGTNNFCNKSAYVCVNTQSTALQLLLTNNYFVYTSCTHLSTAEPLLLQLSGQFTTVKLQLLPVLCTANICSLTTSTGLIGAATWRTKHLHRHDRCYFAHQTLNTAPTTGAATANILAVTAVLVVRAPNNSCRSACSSEQRELCISYMIQCKCEQ
jgi:hypothetical protein